MVRREISDAANEIDRQLRRNPLEAGESRLDARRILLIPPLGVIFEVREADNSVLVLTVWRFSTHDENE